jgi:hypothetical protein
LSTMHSITMTFNVDDTLQAQMTNKETSTLDRQAKLRLHWLRDAQKKFMADITQICDGRSLEMLRQKSCSSLVVIDETKTLPRAKIHGKGWQLELGDKHSSDGHEYEEAIRDSKNPPSSLTMNCPTLYSKLAMDLAASCPNLSAQAAPESNILVRKKKHRPLHRCPSTNGMVMGIIKPSRYSRGSSNASPPSTTGLNQSVGTIGRSISMSSMHSNISDLAGTDRWVPPGVDFNPNTEVCLFQKYDEPVFF